jgi:hypothetical protein
VREARSASERALQPADVDEVEAETGLRQHDAT